MMPDRAMPETAGRAAAQAVDGPDPLDILFLAQRMPYPPVKGEKIRAFQILRHFAKTHRVHVGCFVDDPDDLPHIPALREYCADLHVARLDPTASRLLCLRGLLTGEALSLPYFRDRGLRRWVQETFRAVRPALVFIYSSTMAQYVLDLPSAGQRTIMDFVDVDSDKWRQYAKTRSWPMNAVYRREADRLLAFDRTVARSVDASLFVSDAEARLFRELAPDVSDRVHVVPNGIDATLYDPASGFARPSDMPDSHPVMTFTGTMDYWPNVDAVVWFAEAILPEVRKAAPDATFMIVGASPAARVRQLSGRPGVVVTGRVPDVRPYIAHADICVAPMRIARGIQNKVLEAMAMGRPVITTPQGFEGIDAEPGRDLLVAADARSYADAVISLARQGDSAGYGAAGRRRVIACHGWAAQLARLDALVGQPSANVAPAR